MKNFLYFLLVFCLALPLCSTHDCNHDELFANTTKHYLNDLTDGRLLQNDENGKYLDFNSRIRIFVDYTQVTIGGETEINTIKRLMNVTASYFYSVLNVTRLNRLFFPATSTRKCNILQIPEVYVTEGTIGDLGIVCGNQQNGAAVYIAKSTPCAFLESNKRPIWGMISFNNAFLKYDQEGFQQMVFVGLHQITHILGFSAAMFSSYPKGNPLFQDTDGLNYLNSPEIQREIKKHYGCETSKGMLLEDQDGTLIASHWEKKVIGNEFMIASNKKGSFMSAFTLALLESTGWYTSVDYSYAEPTVWGSGKGCTFLNIDSCASQQFCVGSTFDCDWDGTGIGRCDIDLFTGSCKVIKYFTNTICVDENYELKNLNAKLQAFERGGSNSRCFKSDYRRTGLASSALNNRCYISVCSFSGNFVYILVGTYILVCSKPNQVITAPPGLEGTLTCPSNFGNYCKQKKTCAYHCNKNGICVNGKCICTGETTFSESCMDVSIFIAPIGSSGGLLGALNDNIGALGSSMNDTSTGIEFQVNTIKEYSIDRKCIQGTVFDMFFGECLKCREVFNCENCNNRGCISCDNGNSPNRNGQCLI